MWRFGCSSLGGLLGLVVRGGVGASGKVSRTIRRSPTADKALQTQNNLALHSYPVALGDAVAALGVGGEVCRNKREGGIKVAHREAHHPCMGGFV